MVEDRFWMVEGSGRRAHSVGGLCLARHASTGETQLGG